MTAKEMFEEMGFEIEQDNERYLIYTQVINHDDYDDVEINKVIFDKRQYLVSSTNQNHYIPISFCVLQAISKQIEELMEINDKEIKIDGNSIQIGNKICYCVDKDLIDYITNLQQENEKLKFENGNLKTNEQINAEVHNKQLEIIEDYKSRCEGTINLIDRTIEIIKQQPTKDDSWILSRLYGLKYALNGSDEK